MDYTRTRRTPDWQGAPELNHRTNTLLLLLILTKKIKVELGFQSRLISLFPPMWKLEQQCSSAGSQQNGES